MVRSRSPPRRAADGERHLVDSAGNPCPGIPFIHPFVRRHPQALVGNDAVDQLSKFKSRLADLASGPGEPHTIDGIVLTKMDAIDEKVRCDSAKWCENHHIVHMLDTSGRRQQEGGV